MLRIFPLEAEPATAPAPSVDESVDDFEIVLGRRQLASLSFVALVALTVASGASYLVGKASASTRPATEVGVTSPSPAPAPTASAPDAAPAAPANKNGIADLLRADAAIPLDDSVFGEPVTDAIYLQVGAMDRGPAMILTAGLRSRGFPAVASPGPSPSVFRVLVGPYKDMPEYEAAKDAVAQLGITAFARTSYGESASRLTDPQ